MNNEFVCIGSIALRDEKTGAFLPQVKIYVRQADLELIALDDLIETFAKIVKGALPH